MKIIQNSSHLILTSIRRRFKENIKNIKKNQNKKITGLDVCIRKSLIATCSLDKTVKVWNYIENTLENNKEFEEEAHAISFHPSGYYLIVALNELVVLLNIFENELIIIKEIFVRNCKEL